MRRIVVFALAAGLLPAAASYAAFPENPEGCVATNPGPAAGQPVGDVKCSFTATRIGDVAGSGSFKVTVTTPVPKGSKPGTKPKVRTYDSTNAGQPQFDVIQIGESVVCEATAPGSAAAAGDPQPVVP